MLNFEEELKKFKPNLKMLRFQRRQKTAKICYQESKQDNMKLSQNLHHRQEQKKLDSN